LNDIEIKIEIEIEIAIETINKICGIST
jgi:hypothetical protein